MIFAVIAFFIIALCGRALFQAWANPLRDVPGPLLARFSRLWILRAYNSRSYEKVNLNLHRTYGPIVRIAPNEYSIDDLDAAKIIYGHGGQFEKSPWYYASGGAKPSETNIFAERKSSVHADIRRKVAFTYSMTALIKMEQYVDNCSILFRKRLSEFSESGVAIDMARWFQFYAFDVIGELTFAKRFGFLETGKDVGGIIAAVDGLISYAAHVGVYAELHPLLSRVVKYLWGGSRNYVVEFTRQQMSERERIGKNRDDAGDFLTRCLESEGKNPEFPRSLTFATCMGNVSAGSDTTSISLSSILYNLCKHPRVLLKLRVELEEKRANGQLSDPVTFRESQDCPYLQVVIKEALRVHPATGFHLGRVVPNGGANIAGRFFPEGAIVGINAWVAHANKSVFGADASEFRPERWLEDKDNSKRMDRYCFMFGQGARTCVGKNISLMEIGKLIPLLVLDYNFDLASPSQELGTENLWFVKQKGFQCQIKKRRNLGDKAYK
ncbi:cytochrome P450 [Leptodontidium sp. 2 PMI_412]|nr:cytochrome P450 [Leptodontidium sp. 2 PMI_412]